MWEERRQNLAEAGRGSYSNQKEWLEELLDYKDALYSDSEFDDSEIGDDN